MNRLVMYARLLRNFSMQLPNLLESVTIRELIQEKKGYCYSHVLKEVLQEFPEYIGIGIMYFGMTYILRAKMAVCLGSGDGFVPNLMRLAQLELNLEGARTLLVDADKPEIGYGGPEWRRPGNDFLLDGVEPLIMTTEEAATNYFPTQPKIDYVHIDADHSYNGCLLDFMLYKDLLAPGGMISIHDTRPNRDLGIELGGPRVIEYIRTLPEFEVMDFPFQGAGTAFIKRIET